MEILFVIIALNLITIFCLLYSRKSDRRVIESLNSDLVEAQIELGEIDALLGNRPVFDHLRNRSSKIHHALVTAGRVDVLQRQNAQLKTGRDL
jgi:hypothetical protein